MVNYRVTVGNIGTVYSGTSEETALKTYQEYVSQSASEYGRAAGESVVLWNDNEPVIEYLGRSE